MTAVGILLIFVLVFIVAYLLLLRIEKLEEEVRHLQAKRCYCPVCIRNGP